ncbi:MAG: hypothetical protein AAGJ54_11065 [Planctomycetota bacterium]
MLLAEYEQLYALARLRLDALDRRVPAAGAALTTFVGLAPLAPTATGLLILVLVPASLVWFLRTAVNHARSFEDALRAIEQIELRVNRLAPNTLLGFQSAHPSRGRSVGGRTGAETVSAVASAAALLLGSCLYLVTEANAATRPVPLSGYAAYVGIVASHLIGVLLSYRRYRYRVTRSG